METRKKRKQSTVKSARTSHKEIEALRHELSKQAVDTHHDIRYVHKHLDKLWEHVAQTNERLGHIEAQINMLSRLVTTLCIEKLGIRLKSFKRLIQRLEQEAIADSEIRDLQELFSMEQSNRRDSF